LSWLGIPLPVFSCLGSLCCGLVFAFAAFGLRAWSDFPSLLWGLIAGRDTADLIGASAVDSSCGAYLLLVFVLFFVIGHYLVIKILRYDILSLLRCSLQLQSLFSMPMLMKTNILCSFKRSKLILHKFLPSWLVLCDTKQPKILEINRSWFLYRDINEI
jgi:hypothetical protein